MAKLNFVQLNIFVDTSTFVMILWWIEIAKVTNEQSVPVTFHHFNVSLQKV